MFCRLICSSSLPPWLLLSIICPLLTKKAYPTIELVATVPPCGIKKKTPRPVLSTTKSNRSVRINPFHLLRGVGAGAETNDGAEGCTGVSTGVGAVEAIPSARLRTDGVNIGVAGDDAIEGVCGESAGVLPTSGVNCA